MKKSISIRMLLSAAVALMLSVSANAQPMPSVDVVPGCKGVLDESQFPTAPEKTFSGLYVRYGALNYNLSGVEYELLLEGASYNYDSENRLVLEMKDNGKWAVVDSFNYYNRTVTEPGDYRLRVAKGPMEGYVSNVVKLNAIGYCDTYVTGAYTAGSQWNDPFEGEIIHRPTVYFRVYKDRYDYNYYCTDVDDADYAGDIFTMKWYRYNPWTGEKTEVTPTARGNYKITKEDIGHEIICEVKGDGEHCNFFYNFNCHIVRLPLVGKPVYVNHDGAIINTEYVLTDPQNQLALKYYDYELGSYVDVDFTAVEKQPGQYALQMDFMPEYLEVTYQSPIVTLNQYFDYIDINDEDGFNSPFRPLSIQNYPEAMRATAFLGNDTVSDAKIVAYRWNLSGEMEATPLEANEWGETGLLTGEYYLKASADGAVDTYFPNADTWENAVAVRTNVKTYAEEFWFREDTVYNIQLIPVPAATTGTGTVSGHVATEPKAASLRMVAPQAEGNSILLKDKMTGDIIAVTKTDANGDFKFENLPFGDYVVVPDVAGCTLANAIEVSLSEGNDTADNINYTVSDGVITPEGGAGGSGDANGDNAVDVSDISVIASYILGNDPEPFDASAADINGDGDIDVTDVSGVANFILYNTK